MKLLRIDSSPMGPASISRQLTEQFVTEWLKANPLGRVVSRDLTAIAVPVIDAEWVAANYTPEGSRTQRQKDSLALSTELVAELLGAEEYVIGMPVHNWGPPAPFKLWVDQIVTPLTLSTRPLRKKRATVLIAAGAVLSPGSPGASQNHLVPWLRTVFESLGLTDMRFVLADGAREVRQGRIDRTTFLSPYRKAVEALFTKE